MQQAAYGTWTSPISGEFLAGRSVRYSEPRWFANTLYWLETRPTEQGRQTLLRRTASGSIEELLPAPWNARSKAQEYGGGNYCVTPTHVFFVNGDDQQIYGLNLKDRSFTPLTNQPMCRFADLYFDQNSLYLYAICEDHGAGKPHPLNSLQRFATHTAWPSRPENIENQHDFVSNPRVSPCGQWLSYLTWDHPNMPWDATQIWLRALNSHQVGEPLRVAGSDNESLFQPQWNPNGDLYWVSDGSEWWNLRCLPNSELSLIATEEHLHKIKNILPLSAEFATPQWVFGMSTYGFLDANSMLATCSQNGTWQLGIVTIKNGDGLWQPLISDCNAISNVGAEAGAGVFVGASPTSPAAIYSVHDHSINKIVGQPEDIQTNEISLPQAFEFSSGHSATAYGFYYPPANSQYCAPPGTTPPLIVVGHGGPTGSADPSFNYKIQYWTHRGFAVVDVNYRGSTGYGRAFRNALKNQWGVADVEDLCAAADFATAQGWANPNQRIIRGSSAGGFSVLAALTDSTTFNAGVSLYGIGDLELLATDTHKFEARYLDSLIGPYPEQKALYIERSPIHKVDKIHCPLIVFQGLQDKVVPPNQAQSMVNAVEKKGLPVAYVTYSDEGHGFRKATNISHQVEAELYFYQTLFGLAPEKENPPIVIRNWRSQT